MIVSLSEVLEYAEAQKCAIGSFNTTNLECIRAVIDAAEKLAVPVIISHAQVHDNVAPLQVIGPVMVLMAKQAKVPVCVHLDHCEDLAYMEQALKIGFTGVMYDGSTLRLEENIENTRKAVEMAKKYDANVEAELGTLSTAESGEALAGPVYTDPNMAKRFVDATGIDALAPSFGTAHGFYKAQPVLDLDLVQNIKQMVNRPLVMHGGSGVSDENYRAAIANGIRKINYYSYMSREGSEAAKALLASKDVAYYHDLAYIAKAAMQADAERAMRIFCGI